MRNKLIVVEFVISLISATATVAAAFAAWRSVRQVEETRKDEFLPIIKVKLALQYNPSAGDAEVRATAIFQNVGKGIAENARIYMKDKLRTKNYTVEPKLDVDAHKGFVYKSSELGEEQIPLLVEYKDVYGRKLFTSTSLVKEDNWYHNRESDWHFVK